MEVKLLMNFDNAWNRRVVVIDNQNVNSKNIEAVMTFDGGTASMVMPGYLKDADRVGAELKRAWETYCKNKPYYLCSISEIQIIDCKNTNKVIGKIA